MDFASILVGLIIIAICVLPFVMLHLSSIKNKKQRLQSLLGLAAAHGCTVDQHEVNGTYMIGVDTLRKHLFFICRHKDTDTSQVANLKDYSLCKVIKSNRVVSSQGNTTIASIGLSFTPRNDGAELRLTLYDEKVKSMVSSELESAERWCKQFQGLLK